MIVPVLPDGKLFLEVGKREELVRGVEILVILAVTTLDLAIVPGCVGLDDLMPDAQFVQGPLKERQPG